MFEVKNALEYKSKRKKTQFLLENWLPIPKNSITMISAAGGVGKSFLSIQIAIKTIMENKDRKVLLWSSEDDIGEIMERVCGILEHILDITNPQEQDEILAKIDIVDAEELPPHINREDFDREKLAKRFTKYNLVILDPLIAYFSGNENDNSQAREFMNILNSMVKKGLFTLILIHHHNKDKEATTTRGASAFVDAVRLLYTISVGENDVNGTKREIAIEKDNLGVRTKLTDSKFNRVVLPPQNPAPIVYFDNPIANKIAENLGNVVIEPEEEPINTEVLNTLKQKGINFE